MTLLNESGPRVVDINFSSDSASTSGDVEAMELTLTKHNNKKKVWQLVLKHKQKHSIIYIEKLSDVKRPTRTLKPKQRHSIIYIEKLAV